MDARSTFLDRCACDVVTDLESRSPLSDWGPRGMAEAQANPRFIRRSLERERNPRGVA